MTALLNSLFGALTPLWEMSLTAVYVTAVVVLLRFVLKKRAPKQVLCLLWLVVFARLLIPVNLESPFSILPDEERVQAVQSLPSRLAGAEPSAAPVQNPAPVQTSGVTMNPVSQGSVSSAAPALTVPDGVTPNAQPQAPAGFPWQALLAGVWLAGAAAMCLYALASYLSLKSRLYDAIRAEDGAWEHPSVGSPFILGVFRPRVYLPAGLWGMPRKFILCHERAHLRRLDHIVKPVCWMALALHWFNPAAWLAFILMSRDIEAACDEAVIRRLGPKVKADYSATLLSLATNGRVPAPCPLAFDEGDAKGRIQNVLRYRRPALWIVVVSVIMAVMAAVCLLTDPVSAQGDPDPDVSESQSADSLLDPWMEEILAGRQNFTSADTGEHVSIDLLNGAYPPDAPFNSITLSQFAVVDLNRDGVNELVLSPSIDGDGSLERISTLGYLILHRQGDEVSSYNLGYRAFGSLKADGTFWFSSSASDGGYAYLRFADGGCVTDEVTYSRGAYDEASGEMRVSYFVEGRAAEQAEFDAAVEAWNAKPDVTWHVYNSDGQVSAAPISVPIPLGDDASTISVPDFLDEEQQLLYRQAHTMYSHIFGANTEEVDSWPEAGVYGNSFVVFDSEYTPATGLYSNWADFEQAVLSVFTWEYWDARNNLGDGLPIYKNIDGQLHYIAAARGSGGYNDNFPETFRLVERTDDTISFIMTGYYSDSRPFYDSATDEEIAAWLAAGWESSIEFPMRMVKTENGWRFDEFHNAGTDNGLPEFSAQMMPNPYAPPPPGTSSSSPEPSAEPSPEPTASAAPMVCEHGLDYAFYDYSSGVLTIHCELDDMTYPIPMLATTDNWTGEAEDFDGDGRVEYSFLLTDGSLLIADVHDGQLYLHTFDPNSLLPGFNQNRTAQYAQDETGQMYLDIYYLGKTARIQLETQYHLNHSRTPDPLVYNAYMASFTNGLLWCGATVDLNSVVLDHQQDLHCNWNVRYTGNGFQVIPEEFTFTISE